MNIDPILNLYANAKTRIISNNLHLSNSTFEDSIVSIFDAGSTSLSNYTFEGISDLGEAIISVSKGINVDINGLTISNCTIVSGNNLYYYHHISSEGYTNITGLSIINTNIK